MRRLFRVNRLPQRHHTLKTTTTDATYCLAFTDGCVVAPLLALCSCEWFVLLWCACACDLLIFWQTVHIQGLTRGWYSRPRAGPCPRRLIEFLFLPRRREHLHARALQVIAELSTHMHREIGPHDPHSFWSFCFEKTKLRARQKLPAFRQRQAHKEYRRGVPDARAYAGRANDTHTHMRVQPYIER